VTFQPLATLRVLDLAGEPLARAGRILADLGAEVVLVEPPGGSPSRRLPPLLVAPSGREVSPHFAFTAAGKHSITLDVLTAVGYELLGRLVGCADVVLVTDLAETLRAHRLDYGALRSITPFGSTGPRRRWQGSDLVAWAASGGLVGIGDPDRRPVAPGGDLSHSAGSLNAVAGTLMALRARARTGRGQMVDISMQEAVLSVTMEGGPLYSLEGGSQARTGQRRGTASGSFATRDGFVELLPFMPGQWDALAEWIRDDLGVEEATMDVFRGSMSVRIPFTELIDGWVDQLAGRYLKQDFFVEAQRRGIPCGPVNDPADLLEDPQLEAVGAWTESDYPGVGPLRQPRSPLRFGGEAFDAGAVPDVGEHNDHVFRHQLGLGEDDIASLRAEGII
jgi:benzylsuccinate CoA-transferase BbsE subunit